MKKKLFFQFGLILFAIIIVASCQKQVLEQDESDEVFLKSGSMGNVEKKFRLRVDSGLSDGFIQSYQYNEKGLANKFQIALPESEASNGYSYSATMEYNKRNRMSKAKAFVRPDLNFSTEEFDIVFTYEKDKLVKETWYYPGTMDVYDYLVNTYNKKGQLVKRDDPPYELYTIFHYDNAGNCKRSEIFDYQGNLYYGTEYEYARKIKNPFTSVTGLPVTWFFLDDFQSPNRYTGVKGYFNDENGNQVVYSQWKSEDTKISSGPHNYATYQNSYDVVNDIWTDQVWKYENYAGKRESDEDENHHKVASLGRKANPYAPSQLKFRSKTFRQDMKEIRMKHENAKREVAN